MQNDANRIAALSPGVLLVEDEATVRMLARAGLERCGFRVDEAGGCNAAFGLLADASRSYAAAVVDLGLPDGNGSTVVEHLVRTRPSMAVVVASGSHSGGLPSSVVMFRKPYSALMLGEVVRRAIEANSAFRESPRIAV